MYSTLEEYRLVPYEREWFNRDDSGRYYVVRLKDIPAIAGDGRSRAEAVEDLRQAFDEFVTAWLESGREVPLPVRAFTLPTAAKVPVPWKETNLGGSADDVAAKASSWIDNAVVYRNLVTVEDLVEPKLVCAL